MSGEKKHWRLSAPFRRFSGNQHPRQKSEVGRSRLPSVYLSNDTSTHGFIVVPEFDYPVQSNQNSPPPSLPAITPSSPLSPHNYSSEGQDDDLTQRLGLAYEHIRSMSSAASPTVFLSSDPRTLRKQLGVPQHSVFNHPILSSPDLPNPHAFAPQPASPKSSGPPPTSLDVLHAEQSGSGTITPTPTENSPSQRSPPSRRVHAACASRSKHKPPKLGKRRVEKATFSPSALPSPGREVRRSGLRKPDADTLPSANTCKRQISLPQIRSPSPFRVDIPLHHAWHDRRTDFSPSTKYNSKLDQFHGTNPQRTSGSTEVLASLAWIGIPYTANQECQLASPAFSMGIAVEDESISDDALVDRLEKVRGTSDLFERGRDISCSKSSITAHDAVSPISCPTSPVSDHLAEPRDALAQDAALWQAARKALLCIREIVRTEKKYQEALKMLLNAQTATPPPPSMAPYVSALVRASEILLKRFLEDPSAWGVSTAFVTTEDELEATMVSWCSVAGTFFTDGDDSRSGSSTGRWRLRKSGVVSSSPSATKHASTCLSPQLPPVFSMTNTSSKITEGVAEGCRTGESLQTEQAGGLSQRPERSINQPLTGQPPSRKLSVRDLAIQPIQRVMRYVLLYKDLLDCTPLASPPRLLVERALEAATRIANHCDRAQRNPAFCHAP